MHKTNAVTRVASFMGPYQVFGGSREKGHILAGIWREGSFIFIDLGSKQIYLGFCRNVFEKAKPRNSLAQL